MEYVPGIKINRIAALDELGVDRNRCYDCTLNIHVEKDERPTYPFIFGDFLFLWFA